LILQQVDELLHLDDGPPYEPINLYLQYFLVELDHQLISLQDYQAILKLFYAL